MTTNNKSHPSTLESSQDVEMEDTAATSTANLPPLPPSSSMDIASPSPSPLASPAPTPIPTQNTVLVKQPLEAGTKAPCKWREDEYQECEIIERRMKPGTEEYEYYVHYTSFNRRLDEWVTFDRFDLEALVKAETRRLARKAASERANFASRTKNERKRRDQRRRRPSNSNSNIGKENIPSSKKKDFNGNISTNSRSNNNLNKKNDENDNNNNISSKQQQEKQSSNKNNKNSTNNNNTHDKKHDEITKVKNIHKIIIGSYSIDTWYYSPFPPEYSQYSTLYFCEFCLKFLRSNGALERHCLRCILKHPPGNEIYRKDKISVFEVDGLTNRMYCQNLCYIAKLFLDHKTLFYDVDPFWFYIMCEDDSKGSHIVGYFSKEKYSEEDYNVACILTLPPYQRRGYGKFLISFSYELSKLENLVGSPEKPLSDLGLLGYRSYWSQVLVDLLRNENGSALSIYSISQKTMMKTEDIVGTLQALNLIQYYEGQHIIDMRRVNNMKMGSRGLPCDSSKIVWTPHTMGPGVVIPQPSNGGPGTGRRR